MQGNLVQNILLELQCKKRIYFSQAFGWSCALLGTNQEVPDFVWVNSISVGV
jgi:hypothetical protein